MDGPVMMSSPASPSLDKVPSGFTTRAVIPGNSCPALLIVPIFCSGGTTEIVVQVSVRPSSNGLVVLEYSVATYHNLGLWLRLAIPY